MRTSVEETPDDANDPIAIEGSCDYVRFDELAEEFARRFRRGERPSLQEYADRLPAMADEIRGMFPALVEVEQAEAIVRDDVRENAPGELRETGDYRIVRELGRGGMGVVYEAEQISLGRREDLRRFVADEPIVARPVLLWERGLKWAQRRPGLAASFVVVNLLVAGLLGLGVWSYVRISQALQTAHSERRKADAERTAAFGSARNEAAARRKALQANDSLLASQQELRRTVYATRSNLAYAAWDSADVGRLRSLLDLLRPTPHEPDLRGWEWRYLWALVHENRLALRAQDHSFADVAFSPDGKIVAGLERRGRILLWERVSGKPLRTTGVTKQGVVADLAGGVGAIAFSADGRSLAGPGPEASLMLYAVDSGLPAKSFEGTPGAVQDVAFSPDGRTLIAALSAHSMRVWDAHDGHLIQKVFGGHEGPVAAVAFSPDGRWLVSGHDDHAMRVWELPSGRPLQLIKGHTWAIENVAFSPDGRTIASGARDGTVRLWDSATGGHRITFTRAAVESRGLAFTPDGQTVLWGGADNTIQAADSTTGAARYVLRGHTGAVQDLAMSPDGRTLASVAFDNTGILWDLSERRLRAPLRGHSDKINTAAFSPDGRTLATSSDDNTVRLWDAVDGSHRGVLEGHTDDVYGLAFARDGRLVSSGKDRTIRFWDPASGQTLLILKGHAGRVRCIKFSPDGLTLASASDDRTIKLFEAAPETALASASDDGTVIVWDAPPEDSRPGEHSSPAAPGPR
jgi:eukaryotic-like serine/threonine-protein kinase